MLQEAIDERMAERQDDFLSMFLDAEVDGHRLTNDDVLDIGYLFFIAGLDTVTASLDCMLAYLAQHPEQRQQLVDDPSLIQHAIEEMLRWETPVQGVVRVATEDTEIGGCPIPKGQVVSVMLGSANTDERAWDDADTVDFDREGNRHIAFGGGVHRCLGSHLARMELRVALEEWHRPIPDYRIKDGVRAPVHPGPAGRREPGAGLVTSVRRAPDADRREARRGRAAAATFDNINPATEQVLGVRRRRHRRPTWRAAIAAARTAFDTTTGPPTTRFRKRVPPPAAGGHRVRAGGAARRARGRGRLPGAHHLRPAARRPAARGAHAGRPR